MITFTTPNTHFQEKWAQKLSGGSKVCMTLTMLCFFFIINLPNSLTQAQSVCPYNITLVSKTYNATTNQTTFVWSVMNPNPGNGNGNGTVQDLSHWGFIPNSCPDPDDALQESDIVRAGYGSSPDAATHSSVHVSIKPDKSQDCTGSTPILKFDWGTKGSSPTYYSLVLEGNWSTGTLSAYYKSGVRTGCGFCTIANAGVGCQQPACPTITVNIIPNTSQFLTNRTIGLNTVITGGTAPYTYSWSASSGVTLNSMTSATPTATVDAGVSTTTFDVTVTDANGCTGTGTLTLEQGALCTGLGAPTVQPVSRCGAGSVTLTASGCSNGTLRWYASADATTPLFEGASFTTNVTATTTFYVSCAVNICESTRTPILVTVNEVPTVTANDATVCAGSTVSLTGSPAGGTWSGTGVSGSTFNSAGLAPGDYTVTYTVTANGCTVSATATITVVALPTVTADNATVCVGGTVALTGSPAGGTWSGTGVSGSTFNAAGLAPGNYTVMYSVTANGCTNTATATITVAAPPSVTASNASVCVGSSITLSGTPAGGTWSGTGVTGNTFSAVGLTPGDYTVTYSVTANGCTGSATATITVVALPSVMASNASVCAGGSVTLTGTPAGGTWSGTGVSGSMFNSAGLAPGNYTVTYTVTTNGCSASATAIITVYAVPGSPSAQNVSRCGPGSLTLTATGCAGGTLQWYSASSNGTLLGTGSSYTTGNLTATTTFYVSCLVGTCESPRVPVLAIITPAPSTSFTLTGGSYCQGTGGAAVILSGSEVGVNYQLVRSDNGNNVNVGSPIPGTGSAINFGLQPAGTYRVIAVTAGYDICVNPCTVLIGSAVVTEVPLPTVTANNASVCVGGTVALTGTPAGGTWSGTGVSGSMFNSAGLAPGNYNVTYTVTSNGCTNSATAIVTVVALPTVTANNASVCVGGTVALTGTPAGGTWSGTGVSGSTFSAAGLTPGNYTVTYSVTANGCTASATATVTVNPLPAAFTLTGGAYCAGTAGVAIVLSGSEIGVNYQLRLDGMNIGAVVAGTGNAITFPAVTTTGTYTIIATNATTGCSSNFGSAVVSVNPTPTVTASNASVCVGSTVQLTGSPAGGTWSGAHVSASGMFNAAGLSAGNYTVTYSYTNANGCTGTATATVTVLALPMVTANNASVCEGSTVALVGMPAGGTWSGTGVSGSTFNSSGLTPGTYNVTYTVTSGGCTNSATAVITVVALPVVTANNAVVCLGSSVTLTGSPAGGIWSGTGVSGNIFSSAGLTPGDYTVTYTVTANGCTNSATATVTVATPPTVNIVPNTSQFITNRTIGLSTIIIGGTAPYSYVWSASAGVTLNSTTSATPIATVDAGVSSVTFDVTVTDANGCTGTATITLEQGQLCIGMVAPTVQPVSRCGSGPVSLTASGCANGTLRWYASESATTPLFEGPTFTTNVTATTTFYVSCAMNICESTRTPLVVTVNPLPVVRASDASVCVGSSVTLTGTPAGGTWSGTGVSGSTFSAAGLTPGTYTVTYTVTANGCTNTATATVTVYALPTISAPGASVCVGGTVQLTASPAGGTWSGAHVSASGIFNAAGLSAGNYTVTYSYTNANGCTGTAEQTITVVAYPVCTITGPVNVCVGTTNTYTVPGGATSYQWSVIAGTCTISGSANSPTVNVKAIGAGSYTIRVTVSNGNCVSNCELIINASPLPVTANNVTACPNSTVPLVGSPAGGVWASTNPQIQAAINNTNYTFNSTGIPGGYYPVTYTVTQPNGCTGTAIAYITVIDQSVIGGLAGRVVADGSTGMEVTMNKSTKGILYQLVRNGRKIGSPIEGTGGEISFGTQDVNGDYQVTASTQDGNCTATGAAGRIDVSGGPATARAGKLNVTAFPNPFNDRIRFTINSEYSGQGVLEVYNVLGAKIKTVYEGYINAGRSQNVDFFVPGAQRANMIYKLRVGNHETSGKLINIK